LRKQILLTLPHHSARDGEQMITGGGFFYTENNLKVGFWLRWLFGVKAAQIDDR